MDLSVAEKEWASQCYLDWCEHAQPDTGWAFQ